MLILWCTPQNKEVFLSPKDKVFKHLPLVCHGFVGLGNYHGLRACLILLRQSLVVRNWFYKWTFMILGVCGMSWWLLAVCCENLLCFFVDHMDSPDSNRSRMKQIQMASDQPEGGVSDWINIGRDMQVPSGFTPGFPLGMIFGDRKWSSFMRDLGFPAPISQTIIIYSGLLDSTLYKYHIIPYPLNGHQAFQAARLALSCRAWNQSPGPPIAGILNPQLVSPRGTRSIASVPFPERLVGLLMSERSLW